MPKFFPHDEGPYIGAHEGRYQGEKIIQMALAVDWDGETYTEEDFSADSENYDEATQAAEDYLNTLAPKGFYFGSTEALDWGLWRKG